MSYSSACPLREAENYIFIGEAGSGKTETAVSAAILLKKERGGCVRFFDMDQTKPLLRARDASRLMEDAGVEVRYQEQFLDAPVVAPGVEQSLSDPEVTVVMDVGGGEYGSHMIGQFKKYINSPYTLVYYIINPYRPWSSTREDVLETMRRVLGSAGIESFIPAANPNFGAETTAQDVIEGLEKIRELIPGKEPAFAAVMESLVPEVSSRCGLPLLPVVRGMTPDWA